MGTKAKMMPGGPLILVEDDPDDREVFTDAVRDLAMAIDIKWFPDTKSAFDYLASTQEKVFLIFCDINLPGKNGLDFKRDIDRDPQLRRKSIPFIFFSTAANQPDVNEAYTQMTVQGFFKKENSYSDLKALLSLIFEYWKICKHPNLV